MPRSKTKALATGVYPLPGGGMRIEFSTGRKLKAGRYEIYKEVFHGSVEDAKARRAKLVTEFAEGRLRIPEKGTTLGGYFEKFFTYNEQRVSLGTITRSTADFYEQTIRRYFGGPWESPLAKTTAKQIINVLAGIKDAGRSTDYVLSIFRAFRAAWLAARRLKLQPPDILPDVAAMMPTAVKKRRTVLQPEEVLRLLDAAENDPVTRGILACLATTAMRLNECLGLRWADVDLEQMIVTVEQQVLKKPDKDGNRFGPHKTFKTYGPRTIRLTKMLTEELRRVRAVVAQMRLKAGDAWQDHDLCFPTAAGTPFAYSWWERDRFIPLFAAAKVPRVRAHDLRHSTATFLLAQGVPVPVVMDICGHTEIKTTMGYTHLLVSAQDEAMQKLDRAYGAGLQKPKRG